MAQIFEVLRKFKAKKVKILRQLHLKLERSKENFEPKIWNFLKKLSLPSVRLASYKKNVFIAF